MARTARPGSGARGAREERGSRGTRWVTESAWWRFWDESFVWLQHWLTVCFFYCLSRLCSVSASSWHFIILFPDTVRWWTGREIETFCNFLAIKILIYRIGTREDKFHVHQCQAQIEIWRSPDIHLIFTWHSPDIHLTLTWTSPDHLTIIWPSPDPYKTLT